LDCATFVPKGKEWLAMLKRLRSLGPGLIVMAAFMGPGSVTVASVSGANFGFVVAWSVVFATVATILL
jgi:manganese transport protein